VYFGRRRSIAQQRNIVILDEPVSALDNITEKSIMDGILKMFTGMIWNLFRNARLHVHSGALVRETQQVAFRAERAAIRSKNIR
jgi:ABC-type bacteriocin/lantibiotic exporter with double-glycine peptidase domain